MIDSKKDRWIRDWFEAVIATYPAESASFFRDTKDQFSNPVGATLRRGVREIFEVVSGDSFDPDKAREALLPVVKLRAVQEFPPSVAIGFLFELPRIIARGMRRNDHETRRFLERVSRNLEQAVLMAFDIYMDCKTKVFELKARQSRNQVGKLLVKKGLVDDLPDIGIPVITLKSNPDIPRR